MSSDQKLPRYQIKENPRAKRVILKVSPQRGLVVVIPTGFPKAQVAAIVAAKRQWLEQAFAKINAAGQAAPTVQELPTTILLPAIKAMYTVAYNHTGGSRLQLSQIGTGQLQFSGDCTDREGCQALLKRWLKFTGERHLLPWLQELSQEAGLPFRQAAIRSQKSRWGSCSRQGSINLNANLLFLRPALVRYIFLHELCHTVHLNHSPAFYQLLAQFEPNHLSLRAEMKQAWTQVPWWAK